MLVIRPFVFVTFTTIGIHEGALEAVVFRSHVNDGVVISVCQIEGAVHAADRLERSCVRCTA